MPMGNKVKIISNNNSLKNIFFGKKKERNKLTNAGNSIISTITQKIKGGSNKNNKKTRATKATKAKKAKNAFRSPIPDDTDSIKID